MILLWNKKLQALITIAIYCGCTAVGATTPTFAPTQSFPATPQLGLSAQSIATADFNGDGKPDVVVAGFGGYAACIDLNQMALGAALMNFQPDGCFTAVPSTFPMPLHQAVAVSDFNGDGKPDLVVTNTYEDTISVWLNTTPPGIPEPTFAEQQVFATGRYPSSVGTADVNGDGRPDLLVVNTADNSVSVLLNTTVSGAAAADFAEQQLFAVGSTPVYATAVDLNGDGKPDLIVANQNDNTISILINKTTTGAAAPSFATPQSFGTGVGPYAAGSADINGDGKPDLFVANPGDNTISIFLNTTAVGASEPSFAAPQIVPSDAALSITAADLDGDGKPDLIVANVTTNTVSVYINTTIVAASSASFAAQQSLGALEPQAVTVADLNGDGKPDLMTGDIDGNVAVFINTTGSANVNLDQHGLTGSWFNPATSGQGFEIEVFPDANGPGEGVLFAGWFTYDVTASGGRRWYAIQGNVSKLNTTELLPIFDMEGGNFNALPSIDAHGLLGRASIQFSDCSTGSLSYIFTDGSGRAGTIPLTRITPNVTCSADGGNGAAPSDYLLSGNWFNPITSGQGLIFDFSPSLNLVFGAWYTFKPNGQQIGGPASQDWYTLQSNQFVPGITSLDNIPIVETTGGVFDNSAPVTTTQVGTASISFQSCDAMTLSYQFTTGQNKGSAGSMDLVRVGATPAGCVIH